MIIDFHTHIFPEKLAVKTITKLEAAANVKACADGREQTLIRSMEASGVDVSIVLPVVTAPEQFSTINRFAVSLNEKYSGKNVRLLSFGGIHPDTADYKSKLRELKEMGLQGIKLHPDYQGTYFDDLKYMRILEEASVLGLVTVVHAGIDIGFPDHVHCSVDRILKVLDEVAPQKLVLAHLGGFRVWEDVEQRIAGRDVYLDTAYTEGMIADELFLKILKKHGADRILFATDSPWSGQAESLAQIRRLVVNEQEREMILGRNAQRLITVSVRERRTV